MRYLTYGGLYSYTIDCFKTSYNYSAKLNNATKLLHVIEQHKLGDEQKILSEEQP